MYDTQTFSIMRDPQALAGAKRITSPPSSRDFRQRSEAERAFRRPHQCRRLSRELGRPECGESAGPEGVMQIARYAAAWG